MLIPLYFLAAFVVSPATCCEQKIKRICVSSQESNQEELNTEIDKRCPVCFEDLSLRSHIAPQCANSSATHKLCTECLSRIPNRSCPTCRAPLDRDASVIIPDKLPDGYTMNHTTVGKRTIENLTLHTLNAPNNKLREFVFENNTVPALTFDTNSFYHSVLLSNTINNSIFRKTFFKDCQFEDNTAPESIFDNSRLIDCMINRNTMPKARFQENLMHRCEITACNFENALFTKTRFDSCTIKNLKAHNALFNNCTFFRCVIEDNDFTAAHFIGATFLQCRFKGHNNFTNTNCVGMTLKSNRLGQGLNFTNANLSSVQSIANNKRNIAHIIARAGTIKHALFRNERICRLQSDNQDLSTAVFLGCEIKDTQLSNQIHIPRIQDSLSKKTVIESLLIQLQ